MSLENLGGISRSNLAEGVADLLSKSIAKGDVPPGTRLVEIELAKQLGVSRGPIREALRMLEAKGLVTSTPGRGSFVAQISERDIWEIYSLRGVLEEEAIRLAARRGSDEAIQNLESTLKAMFDAANEENHASVMDLDLQFHRQIWEMADHRRLKTFLEDIAGQVGMYVAVQTQLYDNLATGVSDHEQLLDSLRNRDEDTGAKTMRTHLQVAADMVLDHFRAHQSGDVMDKLTLEK